MVIEKTARAKFFELDVNKSKHLEGAEMKAMAEWSLQAPLLILRSQLTQMSFHRHRSQANRWAESAGLGVGGVGFARK